MKEVSVEQNKATILKLLGEVKREGINDLIQWLKDSDFFESVASRQYHSNVKGGLAHHSLKVYELLKKKVTDYGYDKVYDKETVIIAGLFHDLCKVNTYVQEMRNKKIDGVWKEVPFWKVEDFFPAGHGDKSVIILMHFIKLNKEEILAIRHHMIGDMYNSSYIDQRSFHRAIETIPLAVMLAASDFESTYLFEEIDKENVY